MAVHLNHPLLWDSDHPNLYEVKVTATDLGIYRTHFEAGKENSVDEMLTRSLFDCIDWCRMSAAKETVAAELV